MKCPYCGGEIGLEEKFCSWCGKPNEQALRHQEAMDRYQEAFRETEKTVEKKTKHVVRLLPRLIVILVLLVVSVVSVIVGSQAWELSDALRRRSAERNVAATRAELDSYLDQKDYKSFASYAEYYNIAFYNSPFSDYNYINTCAAEYTTILTRLEEIFLQRDREYWLKNLSSFDIRYLSSSVSEFFDTSERMLNRDITEKDRLCIEDMRRTASGLLRVFLGLDEEGLKEFLAMSENKQAAYLEEVLTGA